MDYNAYDAAVIGHRNLLVGQSLIVCKALDTQYVSISVFDNYTQKLSICQYSVLEYDTLFT